MREEVSEESVSTECLYGCLGDLTFNSAYHVYPFSASQIDLRLEPGIVCDKCNQYFGNKLENHFTHYHPGAWARPLKVPKTRQGKAPKHDTASGEVTRVNQDDKSKITIPCESVSPHVCSDGNIIIEGKYKSKPFDSVIISRTLCKIAIETLVNDRTQNLDPFTKGYDDLRKYIRTGNSSLGYVWFSWRISNENQALPEFYKVIDKATSSPHWFCQIPFPEVEYIIPLPPLVDSASISFKDSGWTTINKPGIFESEYNKISIQLNRIKPEA